MMSIRDCIKCPVAQTNLEAWMHHLSDYHPVPLEWPSDRVERLSGEAVLRPYTAITESKKKRKKDYIPRPLNSFMIFAQFMRRNILMVFNEASNSDISKQLGRIWQGVSGSVKAQYNEEANRLTKIHLQEFPNYKYQPKKKVKPNQQQPPHLTPSNHMPRPNGQVIPLSVKTDPMDHPDGRWPYHFVSSPAPQSTILAGLASPPVTYNGYMPCTPSSHDVHVTSPHHITPHSHDMNANPNSGNEGIFYPLLLDSNGEPLMMTSFSDLPDMMLNGGDLGSLSNHKKEGGSVKEEKTTFIPTPSSVQSDDLMNMVPTNVLAEDAHYDEHFGIFTDQLPNLNSWVANGNLF